MKSKKEIRQQILKMRDEMQLQEVESRSKKIIEKILFIPEYQEAEYILLYADFRHEVMTRELFEDALSKGKKVFFPKCYPGGVMKFYQVVSISQLHQGEWSIYEPDEIDELKFRFDPSKQTLVIIPGVAFDLEGNRVGYGKGYYDRFLAEIKSASRVGLCFAEQIVDEVPSTDEDIKMDKLVTDEIVYSFLRL